MASNLNYKQTVNVERRTWDRETYEARAQARAEAEKAEASSDASKGGGAKRPLQNENDEEPLKEEFIPAAEGAVGPYKSQRAFLKARRDKVDLESMVGKTEIVSAEAVATSSTISDEISPKDGVTKMGVGWHCKVCDCFLKDSLTYLDHINGRKHQRNLGYTMRVEQSTKDDVVAKLAELAKKNNEQQTQEPEIDLSLEDVVKAKDEEAQKRKEERARKRAERKKRMKEEQQPEEEEQEAEMDPAMAAMMGFSGFGGSSKK